MRIITRLLSKVGRAFGGTPPDERERPDLKLRIEVRLEVKSHEVTDEEFAALKLQRKRKAKEWSALGKEQQRKIMIEKFRANAERNRKNAMSLGIKHYIWVAAVLDPAVTCDIGMKNHGKIFSYENPPPEGHPCEGKCNSKDWCRCLTRSIIPGFI